MNENPAPPANEPPPIRESSLFSRLTDVFVTPGSVFEELRPAKPNHANWLVPLLLACVIGVVASWVMLSQENIMRSVREAQQQQMQKQVDAGKMTREQADKALEVAEQFMNPGMMKIFGAIGSMFASTAMLFVVALVLWLLGTKVFHGEFGFMRAVEASGLASMINVVAGVVTTLLVVIKGRLMVSLGPALFIRDLDMNNPAHRALAAISILTLWYVGVLSIALARLSGGSVTKASGWEARSHRWD